jgi:hypothetical protein
MSLVFKLSELIRIRFLRENPDAPESDATMFVLSYITQFIDNNIGKDQELQNVLVKRITKIKKELNDE